MYFNNTLKQVKAINNKDSYGYVETIFKPTKKTYSADVQPYNKELLKKEYGLVSSNVVYRCFLSKKGLSIMDYVEVNEKVLQIVLLNEWENHVEIILGEMKNG